jgi:predicted O-methyltransferase YrrM
MSRFANVFACLVHESPECVLDLVRNLCALDPASPVLLYNGGSDDALLRSPALERSGAIAVPAPKRMHWGRLHEFALDTMRFALSQFEFDALTIVDSDQLAIRAGYSDFLGSHLSAPERVGLLGSAPDRQTLETAIAPARTLFSEADLWRPFIRKFPDGEQKFLYWTFWPTTVFTASAARELVSFWDRDEELKSLLSRSRIWATEEVLLPTLVALLGFEIGRNPASYGYVQFRRNYSVADLESAMRAPHVFWIHPVPRSYANPLRMRVRGRFAEYRRAGLRSSGASEADLPVPRLLRHRQVIETMAGIEGWLEPAEGELLLSAAVEALRGDGARRLVEIGSYCGRSTSVLAAAVKALSPDSRVYAIDPHKGLVGSLDSVLHSGSPTLDRFRANLRRAGVDDVVETVLQCSFEVDWSGAIHLLLIDGLHDYINVSRDFYHFEEFLAPGSLILFHDYAAYYPEVMAFVDELLAQGGYRRIELSHTLMLVQKLDRQPAACGAGVSPRGDLARPICQTIQQLPLVSCIMPTGNRRALVSKAIEYFDRQDYPNLELIILDDGAETVADLIPDDSRFRYHRMPEVRSMGAKHNLACELARGEIICHWDDDDWMAPWRVSYQVQELLSRGPDTLCGLSRLLFYDPVARRAWRYVYPGGSRPWVSGGTFCYRKSVWEQSRFPDLNEGADTRWVWGLAGAVVLPHEDSSFYVATIHGRNTSPRRLQDSRYQPCAAEEIENLLGTDLAFYRSWPLSS